MSPQISYTSPPPTGDPVLDRYLLELHNRIFGLGADSSGDLDDENGVLTSASDTDSVTEGTTNLYFTIERVDDRTAALIQDGEALTWTYNDASGTLTGEVTKGAAVADAAAATVATLTDSTGGSTDNTVSAITAVGGSGATAAQESDINDNFAEVTEEINALIVDNASLRTQLNLALASLRTANLLVT